MVAAVSSSDSSAYSTTVQSPDTPAVKASTAVQQATAASALDASAITKSCPCSRDTNQELVEAVVTLVQSLVRTIAALLAKRASKQKAGKSQHKVKNTVQTGVGTSGRNTKQPTLNGSKPLSSHGFLWKPESDKDHKLAILLPPSLSGKVAELDILSPDGSTILQAGKFSGNGNGERDHFRFTKPGGEFPDGAIVLVKLTDGTSHHVTIKDTEKRYEA
jgi:hypothetical protein